eukprot:EG_transcript_20900
MLILCSPLLLLLWPGWLINGSSLHDINCTSTLCQQCLLGRLPPAPRSVSHAAVIVEPRPTPHLLTVMNNFLRELPSDWPVHVHHSPANLNLLCTHFAPFVHQRRVLLTNIIVNASSTSASWYNTLMLRPAFWSSCPAAKVLIFQTDSVICKSRSRQLKDFLQYDYVGAPQHGRKVMHQNGGLSLRNKASMLRALRSCSNLLHRNEDVFFSTKCHRQVKTAPIPVAKTFSVQSIFYPTHLSFFC